MTRNPFGLVDNTPQPVESSGGDSGWTKMIAGILVGVAVLLAFQKFAPDFDVNPFDGRDGDQQEEREKEPRAAGKTLIFLHERNPQSIEHSLLLREMAEFCKANGLEGGFRALDDDDQSEPVPKAIAYAKSQGVSPPCVVLADQDDHGIRAIPWTNLEGLKAFIQ